MDIYELQRTEHEKIIQMLQTVANAEEQDIAVAFNQFRAELSAHKIAEEQTLFKLLVEKQPDLQNDIDTIKAEHTKLEELFNTIRRSASEVDDLHAGVKALKAVLQADIAEEEQLLALAKNLLSAEEAEAIADNMVNCKLEFEQRLNNRLNPNDETTQ